MNSPANSVALIGSERIAVLDVLRGLALFGILFVNMTWFTGFAVLSVAQKVELGTAAADQVVYWIIQVLVDGKFWSLFAFLFGVGVAIQQQRAESSGRRFETLYLRRLSALFVLGAIHAVFVWFGDIVSLYAVAGLFLFLFLHSSTRTIAICGIVLLALPIVQSGVHLVMHLTSPLSNSVDPGYGPAGLLDEFGRGSYSAVLYANWEFLKERWRIAIYDGRFLKIVGMYLLGMWAGKKRILHDPSRHHHLLERIVILGVVVGLPCNVLAYSAFPNVSLRPPSLEGWIVESLKAIGLPTLCLGYVASIMLVFPVVQDRIVCRWLASVGRMSLTNYVLQSAIGIGLFYGCGIGAWGRIGITYSLIVIVATFSFQIGLSRVWLRHFRHGPLEWLWRCLTYRRVLPALNVVPLDTVEPADEWGGAIESQVDERAGG